MDQPGKVAKPTQGQLNRENDFSPCPRSPLRIWSREAGSAALNRASTHIRHIEAEYGAFEGFSECVHFFTGVLLNASKQRSFKCFCI